MSGNDGESDGLRDRAETAVGTRRRDADLFDLRSATIAAVGTGAYYLLAVTVAPRIYRDLGLLVPFIAIYAVITMYDL
jgi:hypothetical protein